MKTILSLLCVLMLSACTEEKIGPSTYTPYKISLSARTNMPNVFFQFTDRHGKVVNASLQAPGVDYVYDEMKSGDLIFVNAIALDTDQVGYVNCDVMCLNQKMFTHYSGWDSTSKSTVNTFSFRLP